MKKLLFAFFLFSFSIQVNAQENQTHTFKNVIFKPTLGVGVGMMNYYGDITNNRRANNPLISNIGYDFRVSFPLYRGFDIHFNTLIGTVSANENTTTRNLNFSSRVFAGGINAAYNFDHFLPPSRKVDPYISVGFSIVEYLSKTDLFDAFGNPYNYWADGTIRNLPDLPENELISTRLSRDYVYETDIRKANFDGFGNYAQQTFSIPVGVGANLNVTDKISLRVGTSMYFLFNDYIDGITNQSVGVRKGNANNDMFLYTSANLSYNLSNAPKSHLGLSRRDLKALDLGDEDDDGVIDFKDECPQTPYGAPIDKKGCPLDSDNDGVPDYKDLEANTPDSAIVDSLGRSMNKEDLQKVSEMYNDSTSEENYQDTSYALELTDKTRRGNKVVTPNTEGTIVEPSGEKPGVTETTSPASGSPKPIEGLNVPVPKCYDGVVYRVQIMATKAKPAKNPYPSISDLVGTDFGDGYYRFFSGEFNNKAQADNLRNKLKSEGFKDPFVRVFENCNLLPMGAIPKGVPAILPSSATSTTSKNNTLTKIEGIGVPSPSCDGNNAIYRVQIMSTKAKLSNNPFPNIADLSASQFNDGTNKFFVGNYASKAEAQQRLNELKQQGFKGPFIRVFENCSMLPAGAAPSNQTIKPNVAPKTQPNQPTGNNTTPKGNFSLPPNMDEANFKFRVLLAEYSGKAPQAEVQKFENFGPVDQIEQNGKTQLYMGEFPKLDMAKSFLNELKSEGLSNLSITGEYEGKILSTEEFNLLFE